MFNRLGRGIAYYPKTIIALWVVAIGLLAWLAPAWEEQSQDDDISLLPKRSLSVAGYNLLKDAFPEEVFGSKIVFALERTNGPLTKADLHIIDRMSDRLKEVQQTQPELGIHTSSSYRDPLRGNRLISEDKQCTLLVTPLSSPFLAFRTRDATNYLEAELRPIFESETARGLEFYVTGASGVGRDINVAAFTSIDHTTIATFALVILVLIAVYRSPVMACIPLITIGTSVWMSLRILAALSLLPQVQLINIARIFIIVVLFGAGTDYCLFLISRYREQLRSGDDTRKALRGALSRVGWALCASAGTVVCGLGMMGFAEFAKLRYTGPAIALSLIVALIACLTLAPAILQVLGPLAFWPKREHKRAGVLNLEQFRAKKGNDWWERFSHSLAAHPGRYWIGTVGLMLPLALLGWFTEHSHDYCAELHPSSQSIRGLNAIKSHFPPGETGPLTVLVSSDQPWTSQVGRERIASVTKKLSSLPNVAEVRSLSRPRGQPGKQDDSKEANIVSGLLMSVVNRFEKQIAAQKYVSKSNDHSVTRMEVIFRSDPFCEESMATLHEVQGCLNQSLANTETKYNLFGAATVAHDLATVHNSDRLRVNTLVLGGIFVILLGVVRRPIVAAYLLISVIFSYFAAIGATELLTLGWLDNQLGQIDWKVPYFLFTILVAIGEDYNIFLMARVVEESKRHGTWEGTRRALARTGGTITSCGIIMAGTFATMMLCSLTTLIQMGIALAVGVLLDTFVVRPILAPAFLFLISRRERVKQPLHVDEQKLRIAA